MPITIADRHAAGSTGLADRMLTAKRQTFRDLEVPASTCDALFAAVQTHDTLYPDAIAPAAIDLGYDQAQLLRCYALCRQLWMSGIDRGRFRRLATRAIVSGALSKADADDFRTDRSLFKQLRFMSAVLGETHRYPRVFDWTTQTMGRLQDGIKTRDGPAIVRNAIALRFLISRLAYRLLEREIDRFRPASSERFQHHVHGEIDRIEAALCEPDLTGKDFHRLRKIISRQVALYDTLNTLYPSDHHARVVRYLGTINGMMGAVHDDLIVTKTISPADYERSPFRLDTPIRDRLEALVRSFRAGGRRPGARSSAT